MANGLDQHLSLPANRGLVHPRWNRSSAGDGAKVLQESIPIEHQVVEEREQTEGEQGTPKQTLVREGPQE